MWLTAMAGVVIAWRGRVRKTWSCAHRESEKWIIKIDTNCQWHFSIPLHLRECPWSRVPVHKNTVLFRSFWGRCRSCHHSSSNIKSALRRTLHSPYRCPSYPTPRRAGQAWSTLLTSTAARRHVCSKDEGFYWAVTFSEQEAAPGLSLSLNYLAQPFQQHIQQVSI